MSRTTTIDEIRARRPDIAAAFDSLTAYLAKAETTDYVSLVRELMDAYGDADVQHAIQGVSISPVDAGGIAAEYYVPSEVTSTRRIMYIHGGAWIAGTLKNYRALAATLARLSGAPLLLVDYRLAPEHPFPAGLNDCARAYDWFSSQGADGDSPDPRPMLAGDSAGGNLAAALSIKLVQSGRPPPARLALIAGVLDVASNDFIPRHDPLGSADATSTSLALYAPDGDPSDNVLINPMRASDDVLAAFPPTLLQASADEYLMGCSEAFGRRLREQGVRTVISAWPLLPHVWHQFLEGLPEARAALREVADFLNQDA